MIEMRRLENVVIFFQKMETSIKYLLEKFILLFSHQVNSIGLQKSRNCHQMILSTNYYLDQLCQTLGLQLTIYRNC